MRHIYNNLMSFFWPSRANSTILFSVASDTVVNGTLSMPSGPIRNVATTGLSSCFNHMKVPFLRSSVTVIPLALAVKCSHSKNIFVHVEKIRH